MRAANVTKHFLSTIGVHQQTINAIGPKYILLDL
jgi:hypothetical protein